MLNGCAKIISAFTFEPYFYILFYFVSDICTFIFKGNLFQIWGPEVTAIIFIIFSDFLMVKQIFLSPQVKGREIISNKLV